MEKESINESIKTELMNTFKAYSESYTPQWNVDFHKPDIGTAIGMIFIDQMVDNINRYEELLEQYHEEFIDILNLTLNPPKPAKAVIVIDLMHNVIPGIMLQKNSRFSAFGEDENIIFESVAGIYITESVIDTIMYKNSMSEYRLIKGNFNIPDYNGNGYIEINKAKAAKITCDIEENELKNEIIFWHEFAFKGNEDKVIIRFEKGEELLRYIEEGKLSLIYLGDGIEASVDSYSIVNNSIEFATGDNEISGICIRQNESIDESVFIEGVDIYAEGNKRMADIATNDVRECKVDNFTPFGDTIALYEQCIIGSDSCFSKKGSTVTMEFDIEYDLHDIGQSESRDTNLKVIKRRKYSDYKLPKYDVYVDQVIFEYETERGFRPIDGTEIYTDIFHDNGSDGHRKISFRCPEDWEPSEDGVYDGRVLRIRVLKADNCYMQPCSHHYPTIKNLTMAYGYEDNTFNPQKIEKIEGFLRNDVTEMINKGMSTRLFSGNDAHGQNVMFMGFDKKLQGGPVSIWFKMDDDKTISSEEKLFYYYGKNGINRLKVKDNTDNFSHSGTIVFYPPTDMVLSTQFGQPRYFIYIEGIENGMSFGDIRFNGVEVQNIETKDEEEYYIQYSESNMTFDIECRRLLSVDLWVNEVKEHTRMQMLNMQVDNPDQVKIEYDYFGEIRGFYVLWKEVDNFYMSNEKRAYVLDRHNGCIRFGDEKRNLIPKNTTDVAFKVVPHYCSGEKGNVAVGTISDTVSNIMYVDNIANPIDAFGGSKMEQYDELLNRGTGLISAHGRLVTEDDYVREVYSYSDTIYRVTCYEKKSHIYIVLLMSDYSNGAGSFQIIKNELKNHLLSMSDMSITKKNLHILEPLFVNINTTIWIKSDKDSDAFAITSLIEEKLKHFLDPVNGRKGNGWDIGVLPKKSQMIMEINGMREKFSIKNILITASYIDKTGFHECELEKLEGRLDIVIRNGKHKIYSE